MAKKTNDNWLAPKPEDRKDVPWAIRMANGQITWVARPSEKKEQELIESVEEVCRKMDIEKVPQVLIYKSDVPNAFSYVKGSNASGGSIAFSTNIIDLLTKDELRAVIGHEMEHNKHRKRDRATYSGWTLLGASATTSIAAALTAHAIGHQIPALEHHDIIADTAGADIGLVGGFLATSGIQSSIRRSRELESDDQGAKIAGNENMISALKKIEIRLEQILKERDMDPEVLEAAKNAEGTHPLTDKRIKRLEEKDSPTASK